MRTNPVAARASESGFTVVEGLVAALILAVVLIGILPMVTRSMQNNIQGNDATMEANSTIDTLETSYSLPFNSAELNLTAGTTSLDTVDYYLLEGNQWADALGSDTAQFTRTVTLEYFGGKDLQEDGDLDTALDGGTPRGEIQFKRLTVVLERPRTLGRSEYRVVALKAF